VLLNHYGPTLACPLP